MTLVTIHSILKHSFPVSYLIHSSLVFSNLFNPSQISFEDSTFPTKHLTGIPEASLLGLLFPLYTIYVSSFKYRIHSFDDQPHFWVLDSQIQLSDLSLDKESYLKFFGLVWNQRILAEFNMPKNSKTGKTFISPPLYITVVNSIHRPIVSLSEISVTYSQLWSKHIT